ncbi:Dothistromin biosynthesis peroxidase dotB [Fulvia fulva]|uniref:Dothistromin biosynthesis peroxidase dotB n=1 Tax=Passalora fulva TaxID=5499 RepID=A0A9Q8P7N2_PASFU|nr:Dothistromin biosynthesis peroxidase dotB [Fulvia fulva]KAK4616698.1 Dothistromin biosynthesis peroxidase dotB [Fulvia fulva]UJO16216.1 Dothistromin biosynthesis peroxidase dotB [Fulvia fulva]
MKLSTSQILFASVAPLVNAFPAALLERAANDAAMQADADKIAQLLSRRQQGADAAKALFEPVPVFDAQKQLIDVSKGSGHEYVAPGPGDLRGPCPGLNAFANHGFLPHNGYATVSQYIEATETVVGMGPILAGFLSILGGAIDGDLLSWSLGGTPTLAQGGLTGVLGHGLVGSHNKYEGDSSPTRGDLYQAGDNYKTVTSQFQDMINFSPNGVATIESLTNFRSHRFDQQIATNPYFFNGPFTGVLVQPAAYAFIYRFMANHSAENTEGELTHSTLQSWFGVEGTDGNYNAVQGTERIPENWYRRPQAYPYEVTYFLADVINAALLHPKFLDIGGNTGTVNTFAGVNLENLTGGVFNVLDLLKGNNLGCFVFQLSSQAKPDILTGPLNALLGVVGGLVSQLGCRQLKAIDNKQLEAFPGYSRNPVYS